MPPKAQTFFPHENVHYQYYETYDEDPIQFVKAVSPAPTEAQVATNYFCNFFSNNERTK